MKEKAESPSQQREGEPPIEGACNKVDEDQKCIDAYIDIQMVVETDARLGLNLCVLNPVNTSPHLRIQSIQLLLKSPLSHGLTRDR